MLTMSCDRFKYKMEDEAENVLSHGIKARYQLASLSFQNKWSKCRMYPKISQTVNFQLRKISPVEGEK